MIQGVYNTGMTGAERAALDAARKRSMIAGGYSIRGRVCDDGEIPPEYFGKKGLAEGEDLDYINSALRALSFVNGVLFLKSGRLTSRGKELNNHLSMTDIPVLQVDPHMGWHIHKAMDWLASHWVTRLMITGPTQQQAVGIYEKSFTFCDDLLSQDFIRSKWGIFPYSKPLS